MKNIYGETPHEQFTEDTLQLLSNSPIQHSTIAPLAREWIKYAGADTADGIPSQFDVRFTQASQALREAFPDAHEATLARAAHIGRRLALRAISV